MIDPRERFVDQEEVFRIFGDALKAGMWSALPGIVESVDLVAMTVSVLPSIMGKITAPDGSVSDVPMPVLPDVPICFMCGGGGVLTFPIAQGDEALVIFSSLCIDGWWQLGGVQPQTELRLHDLSDGFALIGPRSQAKKITNISATTIQLRSIDGTAYYELNPSTHAINIVAPGGLTVTAPFIHNTGAIIAGFGSGDQVGLQTHTHNQPADSAGDGEEPTLSPNAGT
jgi:hypothetical protein